MKLPPEILLSAINEYCHLPKNNKQLTDEQIEWFADPENVFLMIFIALTAPKELSSQINENIHPWIDTAISELKLTVSSLPAQAKVEIEEVIEQMLAQAQQHAMLNRQWLLLVLAALKKNQFNIKTDISNLMAVNPAERVTERPELKSIIEQTGIDSSIEFIELFEENLTLIPAEALPLLLSELTPYSWGIDALLLLTQYHDQAVALVSAQALNQYSAKEWSQLSNQQLLNLCVRFNRHPALKPYFKTWQKHAMRYGKANEAAQINELYLTHIDGNDCASLMLSITSNGKENQFSILLDSKSGIRETLVNTEPQTSLQNTIKQIQSNEQAEMIPVEFIETSADCLAVTLPWILAIQQEKLTPVDPNSLYWLSQLPFAWTQPEPFNLDNCKQKLNYQADPQRLNSSRLSHTVGNPLMMTWLAPSESILAAQKPKDLLKLYYYPNKDTFAQRLAYSAAIQRHKKTAPQTYEVSSDQYLDLATALYDANINRKKFKLFESLAEISFEEFVIAQHEYEEDINSEAQGLVVKIMLQGAQPAVWRRVHLSNQLTLEEMHALMQTVMGWEDCHLFQFFAKEKAIPEEYYPQLKIASFLTEPGNEIEYCYDFGDNWQHIIRLEKILKRDIHPPKVTAGNGRCPEEDSGGIWNWNHLLKMRKKKNLDEEELEQLEWMGLLPDEPLVPFSKEETNRELQAWSME